MTASTSDTGTPALEISALTCTNCGETLGGRYCASCGQSANESTDVSLKRYMRESLAVITNADSGLIRSFLALFTRPGLLTAEYNAGRRARYLRPLQVFVICNAIYFFGQPLTGYDTLQSRLDIHLTSTPYSGLATAMVENALDDRSIDLGEYRIAFDATISAQARTLVIVLVPLFALVLSAVYALRRRYFVEHLVFSTHFWAFFLLALLIVQFVTLPVYRAGIAWGMSRATMEAFADWGALLIALLPYLYLALRRAYGDSRLSGATRTVAVLLAGAVVLQVYRLVLFFTTYAAI